MRVLAEAETGVVGGGFSLFYPTLFAGQMLVWGATTYGTLTKIKANFLTYSGSAAMINMLTTKISGIPVGAIVTGAIGTLAGYYAYYVVAAI